MGASYHLAVDVGTSRTAAAVARPTADGGLSCSPFPLGRSADNAPSAMFAGDDDLLFGDAAERRGIAEPERLIREFKRRVGDDVPIVAGSRRFAPEEVFALTVSWVIDLVSEREGRLPASLAVTVPVSWGGYRVELVRSALARQGWAGARLLTEPEAAAHHYESTSPLEPGHALAVYDLGGGTFDAIVLRKDAKGQVAIIGDPVGLGDIGGADFDDAVLRHTIRAAGLDPATLIGSGARIGLTTLRRDAVDAKESLSFDSEVVIPVLVGGGSGTVRLTRAELENMIDDRIERTADALDELLDGARIAPADLDAILLTGGSSRIPRVAQVLSERFDRPIATDADPKAIIALGAVRAVAESASPETALMPTEAPVGAPLALAFETTAAVAVTTQEQATDAPFPVAAPVTAPPRRRRWRLATMAGAAGGSLVLAAGFVVVGATATGNATRTADSDASSFFHEILADSMGAEEARAAELPSDQAAAPVANAEPATPETPAAEPAKKPQKRSAPPSDTTTDQKAPSPRSTPPSANSASPSPRSTPPASSKPATAPAQSTTPAGSGSPSTTAPSTAPSSTPSSTPAPTTPAPTTEPTTDPTPAETRAPSPTPAETQTPAPAETPAPAPAETQAPTETPAPSQTPTQSATPDPTPEATQPANEG